MSRMAAYGSTLNLSEEAYATYTRLLRKTLLDCNCSITCKPSGGRMEPFCMNTDAEVKSVATDLAGPAYVTVFYSRPSWVLPNGTVKGWECIIEHQGQLSWILCYHESLTRQGMQEVQFAHNSRGERAMRPWGK